MQVKMNLFDSLDELKASFSSSERRGDGTQ
jgi:hypothetical protein